MPWSTSPCGLASTSWPPTTCTTPSRPVADWPPPWQRCVPVEASTRSRGGCLLHQVPTCVLATSKLAGSLATPAWLNERPSSVWLVRSTCASWRPTCLPFPVLMGPMGCRSPRWPSCDSWSRRLRSVATALAMASTCRAHGRSSTTSSISSNTSTSPAISWWCGTSSSSAERLAFSARAEAQLRTRRSVTCSVSPRPMRSAWGCCSNASWPPSVMVRPTSISTSSPIVEKKPSNTSTNATVDAMPRRLPMSSLTGPSRRCEMQPRRWAMRPASKMHSPRACRAGVR